MSVGDLDGDNDPDLVFPENGNVDGDISWFENMDGKLYRHYLYHEISGISLTKAADIDRDGDLDILATAEEKTPIRQSAKMKLSGIKMLVIVSLLSHG